ncbi:Gfo/Idh/MocA family oxidoreductase [Psychrobacillus sp. INOP01]|uniref:Gfo/Idh/MocA family oxidoreductase n=1 Tax=Psychrobacillus sp. INOP01 TaxID=2829187 RepID=UPI001BA4F743|nr:Gfo/Idh/MocA family oxidoreductase [Psychrobacillus sp. INOP01]QUG40674.1 Gfo/Idh/MocA family oxidoreductase [Psychrobacillus sp. INOP01]
MNIGLIGLDTSHCEIFTRLLNDSGAPHHVTGAKITHAIPTYSEDLPISRERFRNYYEIVTKKYGVIPVEDIEEFMAAVDAVIIGTVDGRNHLDWFKKIVSYSKPIFIDKPVVMSSAEMQELINLSKVNNTPVMSSSSLRFSESVAAVSNNTDIQSGYFFGPTPHQEQMPGYFWYGIHLLEMVVTIFGTEVEKMKIETYKDCEQIHLTFANGKHAILRGENEWHNRFGAILHSKESIHSLRLWEEEKPYYAGLIEQVVHFFETGVSPVAIEETERIVGLIEKINLLSNE